ncbi:MAG: FAD-dependent oxidoreductase [Lysobacterales bacterium]|jgi:phytoene dehydrogenase-like protein
MQVTYQQSSASQDVDAIVIGAGIGGLCSAARLAAAGARVAVLERSPYLGGRCSHRERDGFTVTTGAIMIPMGADSAIREAFDLLDAPMDMVETTGRMRYRLTHGDYDLPETGGGLMGMIEFACEGDTDAASQLFGAIVGGLKSPPGDNGETFREWLTRRTDRPAVIGLFQGFCAALMGTSLHEIPAAEFFRFLGSSSKGSRFGLAAHGNGALMETLGTAIQERGGEIFRGAKCSRITVEDNRVTGVEFSEAGGKTKRLRAEFVLSNLGPRRSIELTGDPGLFDGRWRERLDAAPWSAPIVHFSFVLDEPLLEGFEGSLVFGNTRNLIYLEIPSNISPHLAPRGAALHTAYGAPADARVVDLRADAENALRELESNFPGVLDRAHFMVRARHSGKSPGMHRWPGHMMPVETPVTNLFNVGDGATPPGTIGTEGSAASARAAVNKVLSGESQA